MPLPHISTNKGFDAAASTKLRAETSKIMSCVVKYYEEELDPPRVVSGNDCAIHTDINKTTTESVDRDIDSASVKDLITPVQAQTKTTEGSDTLTSWQDDQDQTCKSCLARRGESCCRWKTLELITQDTSLRWDYFTLKQSGNEWLRRVILMNDTLSVKKKEMVSDVQELWNYSTESPTKESLSQIDELQKAQFSLLKPRRIQCDWHDMHVSGKGFLYDESGKFLQKMIRANAQVTLLVKDIVVPNVFDNDWGRPLYSVYPADDMGELQQLLLPSDLVRNDEAKVTSAPSKTISIADGYLHSLQRTDISLTMASMNVPSVWNHAVTLNGMKNLVTEELKTVVTQPKSPVSSTCISVPVPCQANGIGLKPAITSSEVSPSVKRNDSRNDLLPEGDLLPLAPVRLAATADLSTDYFLSDTFLRCNWSDVPEDINPEDAISKEDMNSKHSKKPLQYNQLLQQIARPALWDLMRKKLLQVDVASFQRALDRVSLEALEAIIYKQCQVVRKMSLNPSAFSSIDIVEACASLRQATWLHTLRIVSIAQIAAARNGEMMAAILSRILPSAKYKLLLGPSNWKDLLTLLEVIGARGEPSGNAIKLAVQETSSSISENDSTPQPPQKRQRLLQAEKENIPVRVMCSVQFLQQDELLDELCTKQQISFIERDLPSPIDMLVDERNCICVVTGAIFQVETSLKSFIFSLARLQLQFQKCWFVIVLDNPPATGMEDAMDLFFSALVQFRVEIQVLTSFSCEEAGRFVRAIVNQCAETALNDHLVLPRMWFERPFLLEDESQFERFLVSTKIINNYAAQSLLHKICMEDLFSKGINELKLLVQNAVTEQQLELLWRLMQQGHGLNGALQ
ncbi:unnamed protein product [Peronospora effusa]|nr:unnamed protein product [Peronospora effusa]